MEYLKQTHLFIDSVILTGDPIQAKSALKHRVYPRECPSEVRIRELREEDIKTLLSIKKEVFKACPELCWFYLNPGFEESEEKSLREGMLDPNHFFLALDVNNHSLGMASFQVEPSNPFWGQCAHMDFILHPNLQKKGFGGWFYSLLIEEMALRSLDTFKGGTSNPAVMKMAQLFKRYPVNFHMRFGKSPYPESHFHAFEKQLSIPTKLKRP